MSKLDDLLHKMFEDAILYGQINVSSYIKEINSDEELADIIGDDFKNIINENLHYGNKV